MELEQDEVIKLLLQLNILLLTGFMLRLPRKHKVEINVKLLLSPKVMLKEGKVLLYLELPFYC